MEKWFPLQFTFIALYRPVYSIIRIRTVWKRFLYPLLLLSFYSVYLFAKQMRASFNARSFYQKHPKNCSPFENCMNAANVYDGTMNFQKKKIQQQHKIHTIIIKRQWDRYYTGERPTITLCARFPFVTACKVVKAQLIGHNTTKNVSVVSNRWWMHMYGIAFNSMMVFYVKYHKHTRTIHTYMLRCTKRET